MKPLYKVGAYFTALVHTVYVPITLATILRPDPGATAIANFGICTAGITIGFFIDSCPLTFLEKWFRRHYSPQWVFPGGWMQYYSRLAAGRIRKFFMGNRYRLHS